MMQTSLGRKLRLLRAERQLSLREAASRAGMVKETISDIERGRTYPHDVTLAKLAKVYDVPLEDLLEEPAAVGAAAGKAEAPPSRSVAGEDDAGPQGAPSVTLDRRLYQIEEVARALNAAWSREVERDEFTGEEYEEAGRGLRALDNLVGDAMVEPIPGDVSEERREIISNALLEAARVVDELGATLARARDKHDSRVLEERGVTELHKLRAPESEKVLRRRDRAAG